MNKQKWLSGVMALSLGLIGASGGALAAPVSAVEGVKTVAAVAAPTGKEGPATINNLTVRSIIPLVVHAEKIYTYTSQGGKVFEPELLTYNGMEFRYLSSDLGTKQQLMNYVKRAFTHNAAAFYAQSQFLEFQGRMAQYNADVGTPLDYKQATARMISKNAATAVFELDIPVVGVQGEIVTSVVKLKKVEGYWRIDMSPDILFRRG
ncbi:DL-endopeptidase inhibitor IseA family protein ['Paenibacillus yunnanensis' Narsing Rao et al. 2020]|uniref:DL-endopeptidase inhibitor IseA family protein n=1 Tax=Paenibacillus tengchongensis TaxID=2608684 RepID=UPI001652149B|nr:DL-endopeptidase inhibitor IseA family protein [Paenibacillus tengchongensis]